MLDLEQYLLVYCLEVTISSLLEFASDPAILNDDVSDTMYVILLRA